MVGLSIVGLVCSWLVFCINQTKGTVDLTLPELQHLANHLTRDECRRLVASLHFNTFKLEQYKTLEDAENALPDDVSCLKLLTHWNSKEGKGKTHEKVSLRLRQIGRSDLASWLDTAVLTELEGEINNVAQEFSEKTTPKEESLPVQVFEKPDDFESIFIRNDQMWSFVPSFTIVVFILVTVVMVTFAVNKVVNRYRLSKMQTLEEERMKIHGYVYSGL